MFICVFGTQDKVCFRVKAQMPNQFPVLPVLWDDVIIESISNPPLTPQEPGAELQMA